LSTEKPRTAPSDPTFSITWSFSVSRKYPSRWSKTISKKSPSRLNRNFTAQISHQIQALDEIGDSASKSSEDSWSRKVFVWIQNEDTIITKKIMHIERQDMCDSAPNHCSYKAGVVGRLPQHVVSNHKSNPLGVNPALAAKEREIPFQACDFILHSG